MKHKLEKLHKTSEAIDNIAQMCAFTSAMNCIIVFIAMMVDHTLVLTCSKFMVLLICLPIMPAGLMGVVGFFIDIKIKNLYKKTA